MRRKKLIVLLLAALIVALVACNPTSPALPLAPTATASPTSMAGLPRWLAINKNGTCPSDVYDGFYDIKANPDSMIYHLPGMTVAAGPQAV